MVLQLALGTPICFPSTAPALSVICGARSKCFCWMGFSKRFWRPGNATHLQIAQRDVHVTTREETERLNVERPASVHVDLQMVHFGVRTHQPEGESEPQTHVHFCCQNVLQIAEGGL